MLTIAHLKEFSFLASEEFGDKSKIISMEIKNDELFVILDTDYGIVNITVKSEDIIEKPTLKLVKE